MTCRAPDCHCLSPCGEMEARAVLEMDEYGRCEVCHVSPCAGGAHCDEVRAFDELIESLEDAETETD
jgi:hypothetical protein